ncbi:MAG: MutS-related protein, family 1 [Ktedonobacterales bacterium]|jgi:ABC-type multidrug transport system fused ATPase/permease subunit|nr:MAG: MutS-related protein, family 1 [Ktedonobacterales bacterium]
MATSAQSQTGQRPSAAGAPAPAEVYRERADRYAPLRDRANRARFASANMTVALFFVTLALLIVALVQLSPLLVLIGILAGVGFVAAFARQGKLDQLHQRYKTLVELNTEALRRLERDWDATPLPQPGPPVATPFYAADLDLLGHGSLQHLLNTVTTPAGQMRLQEWLLRPAAPDVVRARQEAVRELAPLVDLREELTLFGRLSAMTATEYQHFLTWAESEAWFARRRWLLWLSRLLPVIAVGSLVAQVAGLTRLPIWLGVLAINVLLTWLVGKPVERILDEVADRQALFLPYAGIFQQVERQRFAAPALRELQARLTASGLNADGQLRRLGSILRFGDIRLSFFFPVLQAFLLWNFHALWLLERWQRRAGPHVRTWLETLSEIEALAALATLSFDNPTWAFPEITDITEKQPAVLAARDLGHPLLAAEVRIGNDVTVGPPGSFVLVTGSNMSGKSTLLRAIGVNVTLAQMGGPVCARELRLPPVALATSIRISDSLEYGVSYFMAELQRLKLVVDTAEETRTRGERTPLFLLDEILHGTNTSERQIAVRHIIRYLVELGAIGAVSTHDLTLVSVPEIAAISTPVYFTETFTRGPDGPQMRFDYALRPGFATSTNALKLMEIVGLPVVTENAQPENADDASEE